MVAHAPTRALVEVRVEVSGLLPEQSLVQEPLLPREELDVTRRMMVVEEGEEGLLFIIPMINLPELNLFPEVGVMSQVALGQFTRYILNQ